jgi:peptide/nickel transport system ATP-binding protein
MTVTTSPLPVIDAQGVRLDYRLNGRWLYALNDVSLSVQPGEIHGLVGESGSGKSTLALAMMRYLAPNARISRGTIHFNGADLLAMSEAQVRALRGGEIALVPQNALTALNPSYTIGDQISEIPRTHRGMGRAEAEALAADMLRRVHIPDPDIVIRRYPHQLSGGMLQRVMIAMALIAQPRLLILDEPTTALDVTTQAVVLDLFRDLIRATGAAALFVSHNLATIAELCDRVTVLYGGEVMETAPTRDVYRSALNPYTIGLLASLVPRSAATGSRLPSIEGSAPALSEQPHGCAFASRCPLAVDLCRAEQPPLTPIDAQRAVRCHRWPEVQSGAVEVLSVPPGAVRDTPPPPGMLLTARDLVKRFGRRRGVLAVDRVSLDLPHGQTFGLVGESGSGKTTLARAIVALTPADSGDLTLDARPIALRLPDRDARTLQQLQMVFQNPEDSLNPYQTVGQALGRTVRRFDRGQDVKRRIAELLTAVRLSPDYAERYPSELSGGEKQRVAIARAFAAKPSLVVADEPTSALDVSVQAAVLNLLKDLRAREGVSYLFISHDLDVIGYLADTVAVMYLGDIVEVGPSDQVINVPSHPYTEALMSAAPAPDPDAERHVIRLEGDAPSPRNMPPGCRFHTRCPRYLGDICRTQTPPLRDAGNGHVIRCHIPVDELAALQSTQKGQA